MNTLEIASSIGGQLVASEAGLRAAGVAPSGSRPSSRSGHADTYLPVFAGALRPGGQVEVVDSSFRRSAETERQAQRNILQALARRQPDAVPVYEKAFQSSMPRAFASIVGSYGLRSNDAVDALTAYWIMVWVVANRASLPSRAVVLAVRDQVARGYSRSAVAEFDGSQRQILADEAIFNFLVLNGAWRQVSRGSPGDYQRLSDATQRNFLTLGADLRRLDLTASGFRPG